MDFGSAHEKTADRDFTSCQPFGFSIELQRQNDLVVVVDFDIALLDANFDTVLAVVELHVTPTVTADGLAVRLAAGFLTRSRSTAARLRSTAGLLLRDANCNVNAARLLAAGTWIRLPARIENLDDLRLTTRSLVIAVANLDALKQLDRFSLLGFAFVMVKTHHSLTDGGRREQGTVLSSRSCGRCGNNGHSTTNTSKLSHVNSSRLPLDRVIQNQGHRKTETSFCRGAS